MKLILNGGGCAEKTKEIYSVLDSIIDHSKPILCVPLARDKDETGYENSRQWLIAELNNVNSAGLVMAYSSDNLANTNLNDFAMIYISGGNTYKLLKELKETGAFKNIKQYIESGGIVYGSSAGMIIFGKTINTSSDKNDVNLLDTEGYNLACGASFAAHYTNKNEAKTKIATDALTELSFKEPVVALPEEDSLYINDQKIYIFGNKPWYLFKNGAKKEFAPNIEYSMNGFKFVINL